MHDDQYDDQPAPSKTKRKQEMHALQDLGTRLTELPDDKLKQLPLEGDLLAAVMEAKKIRAHGGLRRQLQYIGKLMRSVDPTPIQAQLDAWNGVSKAETARQHQLERWRDRLLADERALAELLDAHPGADAQHLRNLIRNARKEQVEGKPPKSSRLLFRTLRDLTSGEQVPPPDEKEAGQA